MYIAPWDLLKYRSLRYIALGLVILNICKSFLAYAPFVTLQKFGFGLYINSFVISLVEGSGMLIVVPLVTKLERKKTFILVMGSSMLIYSVLIFVKHDDS